MEGFPAIRGLGLMRMRMVRRGRLLRERGLGGLIEVVGVVVESRFELWRGDSWVHYLFRRFYEISRLLSHSCSVDYILHLVLFIQPVSTMGDANEVIWAISLKARAGSLFARISWIHSHPCILYRTTDYFLTWWLPHNTRKSRSLRFFGRTCFPSAYLVCSPIQLVMWQFLPPLVTLRRRTSASITRYAGFQYSIPRILAVLDDRVTALALRLLGGGPS